MSRLEIKTSERQQGKSQLPLFVAALELYEAGAWTCENLTDDQEAELWDNLRMALGLPVGHATSLGIARRHS